MWSYKSTLFLATQHINSQHIILTWSAPVYLNRCRSNDPPKINWKCAENES